MAITVLLADDHHIVREGLRALLNQAEEIEVIGEAADGRTAVKLVQTLSPDVVVMDIGMPDLNGIEATRQIHTWSPAIKILALSIYSNRQYVADMLSAGASGYMLKACAFEELIHAIGVVHRNETYLSPDIAGVVVQEYLNYVSGAKPSTPLLTPREREVLQLLAEGKRTGEIASSLNVSSKTIEKHRTNIMEKLNLHSIAELTKYAVREGLTSL